MDLILHIGTEKTGTTSIQRFLKLNRETLRTQNICFPKAPGATSHTGLAVAARARVKQDALHILRGLESVADVGDYRRRLRDDLVTELGEQNYKLAILSGEHCSSRLITEDEVARLKDILSGLFDRIRVVVYLRRQDEFLLSTYSTYVISGGERDLEIPKQEVRNRRYDYDALTSRWAAVFGAENMICRRYHPASLKNGDVIDDFLEASGLPDKGYERPARSNESLDARALEFLRQMNAHLPRFDANQNNPERGNIGALLAAVSDGPLRGLPGDELATFMASFRQSNARVAETYFGGVLTGSDDPLFPQAKQSRPRVSDYMLTVDDAIVVAARLWSEKQKESLELKGAARQLRKGRRPDDGEDATPQVIEADERQRVREERRRRRERT